VTSVRVLLSRALDLLFRRSRDARLFEEIDTHLDLLAAQHEARGLTPEEARAAARRSFGGVEQVKAVYRDQRGLPAFDAIAFDARFALRMLIKDPRFTVATAVALGLGLAATTSVFALLNTVLIRALPFPEADRLVGVRTVLPDAGEAPVSYRDYLELRRLPAFEGLGAAADGSATIADPGGAGDRADGGRPPERLRRTFVAANTFAVLGRTPALGRTFRADDEQPGAPAVAILSDGLWRQRFAADPAIVGTTVRIDDLAATIVGVMPKGFTYPLIAQLWQPLSASPHVSAAGREVRTLHVVGRLSRGSDLARARAELDAAAVALQQQYPAANAPTNSGARLTARPLRAMTGAAGGARQILLTLLAAAGLVLAIACANAASLLLARSITRAREIAIRAAVGASRWRLVRQLLIECLLLGVLASGIGVVLSRYGARLLATGFDIIEPGLPNVTPYWVDLSMDSSAYGFLAVLCLLTTLAFGLGPALHISGRSVNDILKEGGRSSTAGRGGSRWSSVLITGEIALTLILLTGAGLMWRSFLALYRADLVIETSRLTTMRLSLPEQRYKSPDQLEDFFVRLNDRLVSSPGIAQVTMTSEQLFGPPGGARQLVIAGRSPQAGSKPLTTRYAAVGDRYFETLGLPIVRGRGLTVASGSSETEAVVNERFASLFLPNEDPIGRQVQLRDPRAAGAPSPWMTIVGVSRTLPGTSMNAPPAPAVYVPFRSDPAPPSSMTLVAAGADLPTAAAALREEVRAMDPNLPLYAIEPVEAAVARGRYPQKLLGTWLALLAAIGVVLAAVGLYALTAHGVAQRTQEIGLRMAMGASGSEVIWLFLRRSAAQLAIGLALGVTGALFVGRLFQQFLLHAGARDLVTTSLVALLLIAVAAAASFFPARRASRVDPLVALRHG
jgi:putative ABC transport system permease protein